MRSTISQPGYVLTLHRLENRLHVLSNDLWRHFWVRNHQVFLQMGRRNPFSRCTLWASGKCHHSSHSYRCRWNCGYLCCWSSGDVSTPPHEPRSQARHWKNFHYYHCLFFLRTLLCYSSATILRYSGRKRAETNVSNS